MYYNCDDTRLEKIKYTSDLFFKSIQAVLSEVLHYSCSSFYFDGLKELNLTENIGYNKFLFPEERSYGPSFIYDDKAYDFNRSKDGQIILLDNHTGLNKSLEHESLRNSKKNIYFMKNRRAFGWDGSWYLVIEHSIDCNNRETVNEQESVLSISLVIALVIRYNTIMGIVFCNKELDLKGEKKIIANIIVDEDVSKDPASSAAKLVNKIIIH
jgi:hypothetical protein